MQLHHHENAYQLPNRVLVYPNTMDTCRVCERKINETKQEKQNWNKKNEMKTKRENCKKKRKWKNKKKKKMMKKGKMAEKSTLSKGYWKCTTLKYHHALKLCKNWCLSALCIHLSSLFFFCYHRTRSIGWWFGRSVGRTLLQKMNNVWMQFIFMSINLYSHQLILDRGKK